MFFLFLLSLTTASASDSIDINSLRPFWDESFLSQYADACPGNSCREDLGYVDFRSFKIEDRGETVVLEAKSDSFKCSNSRNHSCQYKKVVTAQLEMSKRLVLLTLDPRNSFEIYQDVNAKVTVVTDTGTYSKPSGCYLTRWDRFIRFNCWVDSAPYFSRLSLSVRLPE